MWSSGPDEGYRNGQTGSWSALRTGDGSRHSRRRYRLLQKPILGTTDGECWHCLRVRSFLFEILQAFMTATGAADELRERCAPRGAVPDFLLDFLERHDTGKPVQLPLPMAI